MKKIITLIASLCLSVLCYTAYASLNPQAHFGKYGLQKFSSIEEYQNAYLGKVVKYIPMDSPSYDDRKCFSEKKGKFNTRYVISKITGDNSRMTFLLVEEGTKNKVKMIINVDGTSWAGDATYNITDNYTVPLLLDDEFEADRAAIKGKQVFSEKGELIYTFVDLEMRTMKAKYSSEAEYPVPVYAYNTGILSETKYCKLDNTADFDMLGKVYSNPDVEEYYTVVDLAEKEFSYPPVNLFCLKNSVTGEVTKYAKNELSWFNNLGRKFENPLVKGYYTVIGVNNELSSIPRYVLKYSETGETKLVDVKSASKDAFKDDISGFYYATLSKVEKPSNPATRYGKTSVVEDNGVTKYSYVDKYIDIIIFAQQSQFSFVLKNVSDNTIKVVWNEAVFVDSDGSTSKVMHVGTKYSQRDEDQQPSTIIKGAKIEDIAAPNKNVRYSDVLKEWVVDPMFPSTPNLKVDPIRLMLPIQVKDVVNEYIFIFDVAYQYRHPERLTFEP